MREPHPANAQAICPRCGQRYYLAEGCECLDWTAEELEEYLDRKDELRIDAYDESRDYTDDDISDEAQSLWENWRTEEL